MRRPWRYSTENFSFLCGNDIQVSRVIVEQGHGNQLPDEISASSARMTRNVIVSPCPDNLLQEEIPPVRLGNDSFL